MVLKGCFWFFHILPSLSFFFSTQEKQERGEERKQEKKVRKCKRERR
jgi:hypothetical protein